MGGSSGGSSSGKISYPGYMETIHEAWLGAAGDVVLDLTSAIAAAHSNSPFDGAVPFDPATALADMAVVVGALAEGASWPTVIAAVTAYVDGSVIDTDYINDASDAQSDYLDDEYTNNILPEFESGMRDINAVLSSSFVLGKAYIMSMKVRDVAKHRADLDILMREQRNKMIIASTEVYLKDIFARMSWDKEVASLKVEVDRINIVASKEEADQELAIDERDAKWDLEVFQYGANMMASIAGAASHVTQDQPSQTQSAIGGALSGAAAGSMVMPGWGTAIGAVVGLGMSFM